MKNELNFEIFRRAFSSRIEVAAAVASALQPPSNNLDRLKTAISGFEVEVSTLGQGEVENQYRAYLAGVGLFAVLAEWKHALRSAEPDAQRFISSAKIKASEMDVAATYGGNTRLSKFLDQVEGFVDGGSLKGLTDYLSRWQLPLPMFVNVPTQGHRELRVPTSDKAAQKSEELDTTIAFLKFDIDGEPARKWNYMVPGTAYDLTIEVRVSNWPEGARTLDLIPITVETREQEWLPKFRFERPDGKGPFSLTGTKRAILEVAHSFGSRPYEFKYAAEFDDTSSSRQVAIIGHRQLRLEGTDIASKPLTGFSNVDRHLLGLRDRLRSFPGLNPADIANTMIVLCGLGNIAAQALKQGTFLAGTSERVFQEKATELLRNRAEIGENLQGHQEAAGGITDLTFRDVPIELKVENDKVLYPKDFQKYFDQTAAYALGLGKRIGVLAVLETSEKAAPVGSPEDDIEFFVHQVGQSAIAMVVVVVRGGFPKPSAYSKGSSSKKRS
jgi:hypothetical protein